MGVKKGKKKQTRYPLGRGVPRRSGRVAARSSRAKARKKTEIHLPVRPEPLPAKPEQPAQASQPACGVLSLNEICPACPRDHSHPEGKQKKKQSQIPSIQKPRFTRRDQLPLLACLPACCQARPPVPPFRKPRFTSSSPFLSRSRDPLTTNLPSDRTMNPSREKLAVPFCRIGPSELHQWEARITSPCRFGRPSRTAGGSSCRRRQSWS
jgi:hypothetical protein